MGDEILKLKTDADVLRDLKERKQSSAKEAKEQRVSFVFGSLDSNSTITREQVRKVVESID